MKRLLIILAVVALVATGIVWMKTRPLVVETCRPAVGTVKEFVAEDGKTRLDEEYLVTMPINGRIRRIELDEGDAVTSGYPVARIDDFALRQQLTQLRSQLDEIQSWIEGVDQTKPKPEDIEAARLKTVEAQFHLESVSKGMDITKVNLAEAERELGRMQNLLNEGVVGRAEYDKAKRVYDELREKLEECQSREKASKQALEIARVNYERIRQSVDDNEYQRGVYLAQARQVESQIEVLRDDLAKTRVRAPVTGIVLEKFIEDEQILTAGTPLLKIGDLDTMEIEADILSEEVGRVRVGQRVEVTGKALDERVIEGRVKRIYPAGFKKISALGVEQQRVKVILDFNNNPLELRPYVSVDIRIIINEHKDVLTVPEQSVFKHDGQWAVLVIEDDRIALRPVEIGLRNDEVVEIVQGLSGDDIVITEPSNELAAGQRAKPAV